MEIKRLADPRTRQAHSAIIGFRHAFWGKMQSFQYNLFSGFDSATEFDLESEKTLIAPALATKNGNLNKVRAEDSAIHSWYRFVLSFPPHLVRDYLEKFGIGPEQRVLDPFCGTGTTLVECKKLGIESLGIEANPIAHFASTVKLNWTPNPQLLRSRSNEIATDVQMALESDGHDSLELFRPSSKTAKPLLTLDESKFKLILSNSISPLPLHKTLLLIQRLNKNKSRILYQHQQLALAKAIVNSISNLSFGPEVGVGKPKLDAPVLSSWIQNINSMAKDLETYQENNKKADVYHADARQIKDLLEPNSIDAVITSPPYPNEKDYTRTTRLESVLLGFIDSKDDLRKLKQGMVRSNTRNVYKADDDDLLIEGNEAIQRIADEIERRRIELGKTSGFERLYARVTKLYFGGMMKHLSDLRPKLRAGAHLAYVVGDQASYLRVMIRTGELLEEIASTLGYEVIGRDLFRTRLATATREQLREEVVLLRWPGKDSRASLRKTVNRR
ncbi:MAG TPA: DNA methyltransferase [Chlamydiales bacterium]|nr:DNA methyltransferase [Chlamydiales bacterium]